jgi:hypothetical protein
LVETASAVIIPTSKQASVAWVETEAVVIAVTPEASDRELWAMIEVVSSAPETSHPEYATMLQSQFVEPLNVPEKLSVAVPSALRAKT